MAGAVNVAFFGSSAFSLPSLRALAGSRRHRLVGVVSQPDRPRGRNRKVEVGVVHQAALDLGLPVMTPEKIGSGEALTTLQDWKPEAIAVASYGQYIPSRVLAIPPAGTVNVHPSLLPKYRGAAPMQWAIASGEGISGVTIFYVTRQMDAGDILLQEAHPVFPDENAAHLEERFSRLGAELLLRALDGMEDGSIHRVPQQEAEATYAPKISKEDGLLDWRQPAIKLHNRIRGFQPWPGGFFLHAGSRIRVWRSRVEAGQGRPGEVLEAGGEGPLIMTGDAALRLVELQPEGKKVMSGHAFLCGHSWRPGMVLEVNGPPAS